MFLTILKLLKGKNRLLLTRHVRFPNQYVSDETIVFILCFSAAAGS